MHLKSTVIATQFKIAIWNCTLDPFIVTRLNKNKKHCAIPIHSHFLSKERCKFVWNKQPNFYTQWNTICIWIKWRIYILLMLIIYPCHLQENRRTLLWQWAFKLLTQVLFMSAVKKIWVILWYIWKNEKCQRLLYRRRIFVFYRRRIFFQENLTKILFWF